MQQRCVNFFVSLIDLNDYLENDRNHSYFKGIIWSIRSLFTFLQDLVAYNSIIIEILEENINIMFWNELSAY
jgi:hypothetical protein